MTVSYCQKLKTVICFMAPILFLFNSFIFIYKMPNHNLPICLDWSGWRDKQRENGERQTRTEEHGVSLKVPQKSNATAA